MKRSLRWIFLALFLTAAAAVIWFLQLFVQVKDTMQFIEWDSSVQILEDGTEQDFSEDILGTSTDLTGTYRFTGVLPENLPSGTLLFETSGLEITLTLNGSEIWNSHLSSPLENADLAQASIPLPENSSGELVFTCTILDGSYLGFPPLIRFLPTALETIQDTAFANRLAFPAGAAALSLTLVFGIFLLGLMQKKPDFSLLPLLLALLGLTAFRLILEQGSYFLPEKVCSWLSHPRIGLLILAALLLYLVMNRRRHFWKHFGIAAAASAAAFGICFLVSFASGGRLARTTLALLEELTMVSDAAR